MSYHWCDFRVVMDLLSKLRETQNAMLRTRILRMIHDVCSRHTVCSSFVAEETIRLLTAAGQ